MLRRAVLPDDAGEALARWSRLGIQRFAAVGLLERVWELRATVSAYDATYVALAEALGCDLVTADARLAQAAGPALSHHGRAALSASQEPVGNVPARLFTAS